MGESLEYACASVRGAGVAPVDGDWAYRSVARMRAPAPSAVEHSATSLRVAPA